MEHEFDAVFEDGVLRPLEPLKLPERSRVHVTLTENGASVSQDDLDRQRESLAGLIADMESLPKNLSGDGVSGRDHDRILYGWDKK